MAKLQSPLLSLGAKGSLGETLSFAERRGVHIAEKKPIPTDLKTLPQMYQRWLYQDYAAWWLEQSAATKLIWRKTGSLAGITGFNAWMRNRLNTLPDIVLWYRMDEQTGTTAYDSGPNGLNAAVTGATITPGNIANARLFDGLDDKLIISHNSLLNLTTWTIEMNVYRHRQGATEYLFVKDNTGSGLAVNYALQILANNTIRGSIGIPGGPAYSIDSIITLEAFRKYHLAFTFTRPTAKLYINGQLAREKVLDADPVPNDKPLFIGRWHVWFPYDGWADNALLYNRALTGSDILRHSLRRYPLK